MKILGVNFSSNHQFKITEGDKAWVEENFKWLMEVYGYPNKMQPQILFTPAFFPLTFSQDVVSPGHVVADLCKLFALEDDVVRFEVVSDHREWRAASPEIHGEVFECETRFLKGNHLIFIAESLVPHREALVFTLIREFIQIRLHESEIEFDVGGDDTSMFIYLAGIYLGFGVILAQSLVHSEDGGSETWEMKWYDGSPMPGFVMAFALATYAHMRGEDDPLWKNEFDPRFRTTFDEAMKFIHEHPNDLYDDVEIKCNELFEEAEQYFETRRLDDAISTLQKILFLTKDDLMKADVYNNMGYYYILMKDYQSGISNFRKALAFGSEYGYANDNLGYSLIMTGELEEGLSFVKKAMETGNNDIAYSYRNLALYYQKKEQPDLAEEFFRKAFAEHTPVDLLDYHYGEFQLEQGNKEKAIEYFIASADKKEEPGLTRVREFGLPG